MSVEHMSRPIVVALAVAAIATTGAPAVAGNPSGNPRDLALAIAKWNLAGQYGRVWQTLEPRYRRVVPRPVWEACQRRNAKRLEGAQVSGVKVTDSYPDVITLPLLGRKHVVAVTSQATVEIAGQRRTVTGTSYYAKVGGRWYALWQPETFRAYKARRCPG
jgi:hypothetical protein